MEVLGPKKVSAAELTELPHSAVFPVDMIGYFLISGCRNFVAHGPRSAACGLQPFVFGFAGGAVPGKRAHHFADVNVRRHKQRPLILAGFHQLAQCICSS